MDFYLNFPNNKLSNNATDRILSNSNSIDFHKKLSNYSISKLFKLENLSKKLNIKNVYVKDESTRFGLSAFKGLGASYAINKILTENPKINVFCTATDGNHGKAVAWSASINKKKSVVYVPRDTTKNRIDAIAKFGGEVIQLNMNYEETCNHAAKQCVLNNWLLVQDTSWVGYEKIPALIMSGYLTHFKEMEDSINLFQKPKIDIIFLQCGVGSWPASCIWYYMSRYKKNRPKIVLVEPNEASGVLRSFIENQRVSPKGNSKTIMAGLNCGIPSKSAWEIIKNGCDAVMTISDEYTMDAMRTLYNPKENDARIISGESGAAGLAGLIKCIKDPRLSKLNEHIELNSKSRILIFNTEGDTDKESFRSIVDL
jgi:diaminopropionate ammonia-lyase